MECKICGSSDIVTVYEGLIRVGKFGNLSDKKVPVYECRSCSAKWLQSLIKDKVEYYESEAYRKEVDEGFDVQSYFKLHDGEQLKHFNMTGTAIFRNKIVADIGCGAGSFLDYVKSACETAIAIEPASLYRASLAQRGYRVYPYAADALVDYKDKVDVAVSYSVLEHIEDPLSFLRDIHALLAPGGSLIVSTPNADDVLLEVIPEVYSPFYYRKAHLWYFNAAALKNLLETAGFQDNTVTHFHRFGLGNFLTWIRDRQPKGDSRLACISDTMNAVWRSELERTGQSDYLTAVGIKKSK